MGSALARAVCRAVSPDRVLLSNRTPAKAQSLAAELGCRVSDSVTIARQAGRILLGVKPQKMEELLCSIAPVLEKREDRFLLITMASGLTIADIRRMAGKPYPILRIMPNTPASIGEGMILYTCSEEITSEEEQSFLQDFSGAGRLSALPEGLMDAGAALTGCGPAFVDLFLEALADGGVACGLPRVQALEYAAQMVAGSARLVLESGQHPGVLKDAVCSPGGTTIQGVRALEARGFRSACMEAVLAAFQATQTH